jgi:hypothetical protein
MTPEAVALLQQSVDKVVRLRCTDGELIVAKITLVDFLDEEIVYDMLSRPTNPSMRSLTGSQPTYFTSMRPRLWRP